MAPHGRKRVARDSIRETQASRVINPRFVPTYGEISAKVVRMPTSRRKDQELHQLGQLLDDLVLTPLERARAESILSADGADVAAAATQLFRLTEDKELTPLEQARLERVRSFSTDV